jgi:hypothetical protein
MSPEVLICYDGNMSVPPGLSRETRIRRDRRGQWFDGEIAITNPAIAAAFDRWVDLAPDGRYCLKNSVNWAYVSIEGAPFFVREVEIDPAGLTLHLSDDQSERLDPSTLAVDEEERLVCKVREGKLQAAFTSQAMMQLEPLVGEDEQGVYVMIAGAPIRPLRDSRPKAQDS